MVVARDSVCAFASFLAHASCLPRSRRRQGGLSALRDAGAEVSGHAPFSALKAKAEAIAHQKPPE